MDTIFRCGWVLDFNVVKYFYLCFGLVGVLFIIFHDLQGYWLCSLMVHALVHFPKRPFSQQLQYLISKMYLITLDPIISAIWLGKLIEGGLFDGAILTIIVDFGVGDKFLFLISLQVIGHFQQLHG